VTCGESDALFALVKRTQKFTKQGRGNYGCLGQVSRTADGAMIGISQRDRRLVKVYDGGVALAQHALPDVDLVARAVAVGPHDHRVYVGANRVTRNQRQAEVLRYDEQSGEFTLLAAVGGARLESLAVSHDGRIFFTDSAHSAIHEVLDEPFLAEETTLLVDGPARAINLATGAKHAGGAEGATFYGQSAWRTQLLYGGVTPANAGGIAAMRTPDGTELLLVADAYDVKSLTGAQFVHSWPLGADDERSALLGASTIAVAPPADGKRSFERHVAVADWQAGTLAELSAFAPHLGDFKLRAPLLRELDAPYGVAVTRHGSTLVAEFGAGRVVQSDGFVAAEQLDGPCGIAVGDDNGKLLYVTERSAGRLTRIDVDSGARTALLEGLDAPEGVAVNPLNGHVVVLETSGQRRLLVVDPAAPGEILETIASELAEGAQNAALGADHPYLFSGVAFGDVVGGDAPGSHRHAPLYVAQDGAQRIWRFDAAQTLANAAGKPADDSAAPWPVHEERDGRRVAIVPLFGTGLPPLVAVPQGTWLRFVAFRQDSVHDGLHAPALSYALSSDDIPGFRSSFLYPRTATKPGRAPSQASGPSQYELLLDTPGAYSYVELLANHLGKLIVYDARYDDPESEWYVPDATGAPTPEPTDAPVCRTADSVDCWPGSKLDATSDAQGCLTDLRCIPIGFSLLTYPTYLPDGSIGNMYMIIIYLFIYISSTHLFLFIIVMVELHLMFLVGGE
jgi:sugar lactone lactonase YvrE